MVAIWSPEEKVRAERRLWLAVLVAQRDLGVAVPDGVVEAYESVLDQVDLASIAARERVTRHDVKARIEEFVRAGRARTHSQGDDVARSDRERRAAPDPRLARPRPGADGVGPGPARPPGRWSSRAWSWWAGRTTCRRRRPRWASGSPPRREELLIAYDRIERPARSLSAARHQGPGRYGSGQLDLLGRSGRRLRHWSGRWPTISASPGCSPASGRSIRDRWTSTWSPRWRRRRPARPRSPRRSG